VRSQAIAVLAMLSVLMAADTALGYYNQSLGRWTSEDPLGIDPAGKLSGNYFAIYGQDADGANKYQYARHRPTQRRDATGLKVGPYDPSEPPRYPEPWGTTDFVWHYYFGNGTAVDLAQIGLLETFRNALNVVDATGSYKLHAVMASARAKSGLTCPGRTSAITIGADRTTTDVTPEIFSVGSSTFFESYSCQVQIKCCGSTETCWSYDCTLKFSIRDSFRDPLDVGREAGGTPYPINASWTEYESGGTCDK
jgi:hypothetical protein